MSTSREHQKHEIKYVVGNHCLTLMLNFEISDFQTNTFLVFLFDSSIFAF